MGSDRARNTFDPRKQYRRVIAQQGRVELEADKNEGAEIATETLRQETIDIVGPYGVPSDPITDEIGTGYKIEEAVIIEVAPSAVVSGPPDFEILPGILYLGGWRIEQEVDNLSFYGQKEGEWLTGPTAEVTGIDPPTNESIVLHLSEHEVSAVEDRTLREVALGGPDTTQRMRLTRRVRRFAVDQRGCDGAFGAVVRLMAQRGFSFDDHTMALESMATLLVQPDATPPQTNPCDPVARGGYLGADNQMIRVQLADPLLPSDGGPGAVRMLWAYDDASDLYSITVDPSNLRKLTLATMPVDTYHWPKSQQFVEILRASAKLPDGGLQAADFGRLVKLAADFDPDTATVLVDADIDFAGPLFLRVWQNAQTFTPGTPVELVDRNGSEIGVRVTIAGSIQQWQWQAGEFWMFAVRPGFPEDVFPARYKEAPQPPEGPRQWMAPLAWIAWSEGQAVITDCRPDFDDLVQLTKEIDELAGGGCCTIRVTPADATRLQQILDSLKGRNGATICLAPGIYELKTPLRLTRDHGNFTLEGSEAKVIVRASQGSLPEFQQGIVQIVEATGVVLRHIDFQVGTATLGPQIGMPPGVREDLSAGFEVGLGVRPVNSEVTIEDCSFEFPRAGGNVLCAGIFASGRSALGVRDCAFVGNHAAIAGTPILIGILSTPTVQFGLSPENGDRIQSGAALPAVVEWLAIENSKFFQLRAGALVVGNINHVEIEENDVSACYSGFIVTGTVAWGGLKDFSTLTGDALHLAVLIEAMDADRWLTVAMVVGSSYPLPQGAKQDGLQALPPLAGGKTYEELARDAAASFRGSIVDKIGSQARESPAASVGESALPEFFAAREPPALPVRVFAAARNIQTVLWNIPSFRPTFATEQVQVGSIRVEDNDIDCAASGLASLSALVVFDPNSVVVVNGNRATNMFLSFPTVYLVARRTAVTGNIVINFATALVANELQASFLDHAVQMRKELNISDIQDLAFISRISLAVVPPNLDKVPHTAITGNVCEGRVIVPARPGATPPLPPWQQLNTVVVP